MSDVMSPVNAPAPTASPANYLLYDGECPVCSAYVAVAELRRLWPGLSVLDARGQPELVASLRARGVEINDEVVLCLDGRLYTGAAATRLIGKAGSGHGLMRRFFLATIGVAPYPLLSRGRRLILALLGRRLID